MKTEHPITPPSKLIKQWLAEFYGLDCHPWMAPGEMTLHVAAAAARWGADQELDACCEHLKRSMSPRATVDYLRAARRPKPPSLKEQALEALDQADNGLTEYEWPSRHDIIRRALESLPD